MSDSDWREAVEETDCDSASDFLDALVDVYRMTQHGPRRPDRWAFRGQWDANWELTPSAFRNGTLLGYGCRQEPYAVNTATLDSLEQIEAEHLALCEFLELADKLGLSVPGDCPAFRDHSMRDSFVGLRIGLRQWPPEHVLELLAISQHHGVPTRLLDFSFRPMVAAYFAAAECRTCTASPLGKEGKVGRFAVWGVDLDWVRAPSGWGNPVREVTVPRARNPNLHAQHGLFLYNHSHPMPDEPPDPPELNRVIAEAARRSWADEPLRTRRWYPMVKVTAPRDAAEDLLGLLELEGIDAPHLRPSFDSVVLELQRKRARSS